MQLKPLVVHLLEFAEARERERWEGGRNKDGVVERRRYNYTWTGMEDGGREDGEGKGMGKDRGQWSGMKKNAQDNFL